MSSTRTSDRSHGRLPAWPGPHAWPQRVCWTPSAGASTSFRRSDALLRCRELVAGGEIGEIYAVDACFHNAYGPDKEWFYDPHLSGGGCVIDLGVHIVDLVRWVLDFPDAVAVHARVLHHGY